MVGDSLASILSNFPGYSWSPKPTALQSQFVPNSINLGQQKNVIYILHTHTKLKCSSKRKIYPHSSPELQAINTFRVFSVPGVDKVIGKSEERRWNCAVCDDECQNFPVKCRNGFGILQPRPGWMFLGKWKCAKLLQVTKSLVFSDFYTIFMLSSASLSLDFFNLANLLKSAGCKMKIVKLSSLHHRIFNFHAR